MSIISQICGIGALIALFLIYQQKERKKLIFCKLVADVCWVGHYLFLGAYTGMIAPGVGFFREILFMNREKKQWCDHRFWPVLFILVNWALAMRTYSGPADLLITVASSAVTIALWLKNPKLTKLISIPVSVSFIIYNVTVGSYIGIVNESVTILSIILSFIREKKDENRERNVKHTES